MHPSYLRFGHSFLRQQSHTLTASTRAVRTISKHELSPSRLNQAMSYSSAVPLSIYNRKHHQHHHHNNRKFSQFRTHTHVHSATPSIALLKHMSLSYHSKRMFASEQPKKDYYELLDVPRDSKEADIKKAFYKKAKQWHPDANPAPEAKDRFSEFNEAYQVLSNKEKRANYDQFGHNGPQSADFQDFAGFNLHDIFSQLFSGNGFPGFGGEQQSMDHTSPQRGQELQVEVRLSFMEAVKGCERALKFSRFDECPACDSSGMQPGSVPVKCRVCDGKGMSVTRMGAMVMQQTCYQCAGSGQSIDPCSSCQGTGLKSANATLDVNVPAGVDDGTRVRIASQGHAGRNHGGRGHVWLLCRVKGDERFERNGSDVHVEVEVPAHKAMLGGTVTVPTLNGEAEVKVKAGTQPDHREVMRGKGIREPSTGRIGHQYLHFAIKIPTTLDDKQRELLQEFADIQEAKK